jgi:hypothetical protein
MDVGQELRPLFKLIECARSPFWLALLSRDRPSSLSCTSLLQHMFGEAPLCKLGYIATNPVAGVELLRERSGERAEWSANTRQPGVPGCPSCLMAPLAERSQRQAGGSHAAPQAFERRLGIGEVDMIASSRT